MSSHQAIDIVLGVLAGAALTSLVWAVARHRSAQSTARRESEGRYRRIAVDDTQRKEGEAALRIAKQAADDANLARTDFLANISHEIRTPMNGIVGMTALALGTELTLEQRGYLDTVRLSADALLDIINDILDFSHIEDHTLALDRTEFDLGYVVNDTLRGLGPRARARGLGLTWHLPPLLAATVVGDPARFRQILVHLVGNAIKFTQAGSIRVQVEQTPGAGPGVVLAFTVRDTGIGIAADARGRIFDAFAQADGSSTRRFGGTGLGLTLSSRLIALMGGTIRLESELGHGTQVFVTLPFDIPAPVLAPPAHPGRVDLRGMEVLIVADQVRDWRLLEDSVVEWGLRPTLAVDGPTAVRALDRARAAGRPFPLALVDVQAPDLGRFGVAEQIGDRPELDTTRLVMLMSIGHRGDAARFRELGAAAYLTKPLPPSVLLEAIRAVLAGRDRPLDGQSLVTRHTLNEARRPAHVLLADDNAVHRQLLTALLGKRGLTSVGVSSGSRAVAAVAAEHFDLAVLHAELPGMNGLEATIAIRRAEEGTGTRVPIAVLSPGSSPAGADVHLAAGADWSRPQPPDAGATVTLIESLTGPDRPGLDARRGSGRE